MEFQLPELGEGVYEAELVQWLVHVGDEIHHGQNLMEVLTDKATMEVPAPFHGTIGELLVQPGQPIKVGQPILRFESTQAKTPHAALARESANGAEAVAASTATVAGGSSAASATPVQVKAAPSVRRQARELGVDLSCIHGSGPDGRILNEDLHRPPQRSATAAAMPVIPAPDFGTPGSRVKLAGVRKRIAEHLLYAKRTIPHYSYVDECDVTELVRLRASLREPFAAAGVKLTYLAFFVKTAVAALKQIPLVNASLNDEAGEIVLHDRYHIGFAVETPQGLLVPVIHDADKKDLEQIAKEIERLSGVARLGKATHDDLKGGTFTITSIGNIGGLISTPIINHPEAAIVGIGRIVKRPVYDDAGQIGPAEMLYLSFSFDHRIIDGAVGAAFGNAFMAQLKHPARLLLPPP